MFPDSLFYRQSKLSWMSRKFLDSLDNFHPIWTVLERFKVSRESEDFYEQFGKFLGKLPGCLKGYRIYFPAVWEVLGQFDCSQAISKFPESLDVSALGGQSVKVVHWLKTFQFWYLLLMQKAHVFNEWQLLNDAQLGPNTAQILPN